MGVDMREIRFRGKGFSNEWFEGYLVNCIDNSRGKDEPMSVIFEPDSSFYSKGETEGWYQVHPETICQSTELTDTKGNLIFEGDILESRASENKADWKCWLVEYKDGGFCIMSKTSKKCRKRSSVEVWQLCADEIELLGLVIVGNKFDYPILAESVIGEAECKS